MPSMVTMSVVVTLIGWLGAGLLVLAYGLVSSRRLAGDSVAFQALNGSGALALGINTAYHGAWPSAVLNVVWIGIGLAALARARTRALEPQAALSQR